VQGGGRRQEAAARQCACGRPLERWESWVGWDGLKVAGFWVVTRPERFAG